MVDLIRKDEDSRKIDKPLTKEQLQEYLDGKKDMPAPKEGIVDGRISLP